MRSYDVTNVGFDPIAPRDICSARDAMPHVSLVHLSSLPWGGPITQATFPGTPGNDHVIGTDESDVFLLMDGGRDRAFGAGGDDYFDFGASFTNSDTIDGGDGIDVLNLEGDYGSTIHVHASTMVNVEQLVLEGPYNYSLVFADANLTPIGINDANFDDSFHVFAEGGDGAHAIHVDFGAETDTAITVWGTQGDDWIRTGAGRDLLHGDVGNNYFDGGSGVDRVSHIDLPVSIAVDLSISVAQQIMPGVFNTYRNIENVSGTSYGDDLRGNKYANWLWGEEGNDALSGGRGDDFIEGSQDADIMTGGAGHDHFLFGIDDNLAPVIDSTSINFDTITDFNYNQDVIELPDPVAAVDPVINGGWLSVATFDSDLETYVNAAVLGEKHAVLFKPDHGNYAGEVFLIVDYDGNPGYQASKDVVIHLEDAMHGNIHLSNFAVGTNLGTGPI